MRLSAERASDVPRDMQSDDQQPPDRVSLLFYLADEQVLFSM